jgi:hypothetical protein
VVAGSRDSVPFLAQQLDPVPAVSKEHIAQLLAKLDSQQFKVRVQAGKDLEQLGELAEPALSQTLAGKPSLEARQRIEKLLDTFCTKPLSRDDTQLLRAVEVLENAGTRRARQLLEALAKGAPGARLTNEAQASLDRLAKRMASEP